MRAFGSSALLWVVGCGETEGDTPSAGELDGPCYGNSTCNDGLACESDLCRVAEQAVTGARAGGGSLGVGGAADQAGDTSAGGTSAGGTSAGGTSAGGSGHGGEPLEDELELTRRLHATNADESNGSEHWLKDYGPIVLMVDETKVLFVDIDLTGVVKIELTMTASFGGGVLEVRGGVGGGQLIGAVTVPEAGVGWGTKAETVEMEFVAPLGHLEELSVTCSSTPYTNCGKLGSIDLWSIAPAEE